MRYRQSLLPFLASLAIVLAPWPGDSSDAQAQSARCVSELGFGLDSAWPLTTDDGLQAALAEEGYVVSVTGPGTPDQGASAAVGNPCPLGDFVLSIDARLVDPGGTGYVVQLRRQTNGDRLALVVEPERRLATFYRRTDDQTTILWGWAPVEALHGGDDTDHLTFQALGPRIRLDVNGQQVFQVEAGGPTQGSLWLGTVTWSHPARTVFSNLLAGNLAESSALARAPTGTP